MGTSSTARECPPSHDRIFQTSDLGACPTLTFYCGERSATICVVLGPKKSSMYSSEHTSGFSGPAASHLAAPPSPRHEGNVGQAPSLRSSETGETCGKGATRSSGFEVLRISNFGHRTLARHASRASRAPRQDFIKKWLEIASTFGTVRVGSAEGLLRGAA